MADLDILQTAISGWTSGGTATTSASLSATPTVGNLLVFIYGGMTYSPSSFAYMSLPTGASIAGQVNCIDTGDGSVTYMQLNVAYRVVQSGDGKVWTIDAPANSTNPTIQATVGYALTVREVVIGAGYTPYIDVGTFGWVGADTARPSSGQGPTVTPSYYNARVLGSGVGFTTAAGSSFAANTQADDLPTSGWTIDEDQYTSGLYGEQFDASASVLVTSGNADFSGGYFTGYVNVDNYESCWTVTAVSESIVETNANASAASVTVNAFAASVTSSASVTAGGASVAVTAYDATAPTLALASAASVTVGAFDITGSASVHPNAASVDVLAYNPAASIPPVPVNATTASVSVSAYSASVTAYGQIIQVNPNGGPTTPAASSAFSDQILTMGNDGPVTFTTTDPSGIVVSSSGLVTTTGPLLDGSYTASGTTADGFGHTGTFSYTLVVGALQMPTTTVELSYTPLFGTLDWVDVSQYVRSFNTTAGRQHELDQIQAGTLTMVLDNRTGQFTPWLAASVALVPMTAVRITATWDSVTYPIFYGYIHAALEVDPDFTNSDVQIQASDLFGYLSIQKLDSSNIIPPYTGASTGGNGLYENSVLQYAPQAYYTFNHANWGQDYSGNNYGASPQVISTLFGSYTSKVTSGVQGPILYDAATAISLGDNATNSNPQGSIQLPEAAVAGSGGWTIEFWLQVPTKAATAATGGATNQTYIYEVFDTGSATYYGAIICDLATPAIIWESGPPGSPSCTVTAEVDFNDGKWHYIVVSGSSRSGTVSIYFEGVLQQTGSGGTTNPYLSGHAPIIGGWFNVLEWQPSFRGSIGQWAFYDTELSSAVIAGHYAIGAYFATEVYSGTRIRQCLETVGVPNSLFSSGFEWTIDTGIAFLQAETSPVTGTDPLSYMISVQQTEDGLLYVAPDGTVTFYQRDHFSTFAGSVAPSAIFSDSAGASVSGLPNCNYEPGLSIIRDDLDLWTVITVTRQNGITQVASNSNSIDAYGRRVGPTGGLNGVLFSSDAQSLTLAEWLLARYKDSIPRPSKVDLASTANQGVNLPYMLGLQLWDVVTLQRTYAPGSTVFTQGEVIEYVAHTFVPDKWVTSYVLSPYELLNT